MGDFIARIMEVTGGSSEEAAYYLEAARGDVDTALELFFEAKNNENPSINQNSMSEDDDDYIPDDSTSGNEEAIDSLPSSRNSVPKKSTIAQPQKLPLSSAISKNTKKTNDSNNGPRIATFASLSKNQNSDDDDEDEEGSQSMYAGGEKSGLYMKMPKDLPNADLISSIVQKAQQHSKNDEENIRDEQPEKFSGHGYRLGSEESSSLPPSSSSQFSSKSSSESKIIKKTVCMWRNGFTIEGDEFRDYNNPENQALLQSIHRGVLPLHVVGLNPGDFQTPPQIELGLEMRLDEDFQEKSTKAASTPFSGSGYRLGNIAPFTKSSSPASPSFSSSAKKSVITPIKVDDSLPVTSLQIRLNDGSRLVGRFNTHHTINDVRNFIETSHPESAQRAYRLMTPFPNRELTDSGKTLVEYQLQNTVIVQKYE